MPFKGVHHPQADRHAHSREARWPGKPIGWTIRTLALVALAAASYLAGVSLISGAAVAGCGGLPAVDCQHVLTSRWARWLGVPVSYPAVGVYGLLALASFFVGPTRSLSVRRAARFFLVLLAALAAGSALWFLILLVFVLGKVCVFCFAVHLCGLTIGILLVIHPPVHRRRYSPEWLGALRTCMGMPTSSAPKEPAQTLTLQAVLTAAGLGLMGVGVLIAGQLLFPSRTYRIEQFRSAAGAERAEQPSPFVPLTSSPSDPVTPSPSQPLTPSPPDAVPPPSPEKSARTGSPASESRRPQDTPELPALRLEPEASAKDVPATEAAALPPLPKPDSVLKGPRWVPLLDNEARLDVYAHPLLGDPEAEHVVVELFDYTCKHCRAQSRQMEEARARYGPQLAVVLLVMPMSPVCNKYVQDVQQEHQNACRYAKLALAAWKAAPSRFPEFHHWLMEGDEPPPLEAAQGHATELLGGKAWQDELEGPAVRAEIEHNTELFHRCKGGVIPKLLSGKYVVSGETATADQLFELLERITSMKPLRR